MDTLVGRLAKRWLEATRRQVIPLGDMAVFPGRDHQKDFWRGSGDSTLNPGEYVAESPQDALWYARNFAAGGYVTGYDIPGNVLDATRDPIGVLQEASGIVDFGHYDQAWEIMEGIPGVIEELRDQGYTLVKFHDVAPTRGTVAYKYIGTRPLAGQPFLKVVTDRDIQTYLPQLSKALWGDPKALPPTGHGWRALGEAMEEVRLGFDLEDPEYYLESAPRGLYVGTMYQFDDALNAS